MARFVPNKTHTRSLSTPRDAVAGLTSSLSSPGLLAVLPTVLAESELFADSFGPSSPTFGGGGGGGLSPSAFSGGEELHAEVAGEEHGHPELGFDFSFLGCGGGGFPPTTITAVVTTAAVPDVASIDMDIDAGLLNELDSLESNPPWESVAAAVKIEPESMMMDAAPVKQEQTADGMVPVLTLPAGTPRPPHGPKSRTKMQEEIKDDLDATIYGLFSVASLKLSREDFKAWREGANVRKLSGSEQRRLSEIRRMLRARVFAERTRIRKLAETKTCGKTLSSLKSENTKLKKRVARFEATEIKLQAQIKKLMAEKRTAGR